MDYREEKKLSREELGGMLGCSASVIGAIERGGSPSTLRIAFAIARKVGIDVNDWDVWG